MKPIENNLGNKPWRVLIPACWDRNKKRKPIYFDTKRQAEDYIKRTKEIKRKLGDVAITPEDVRWLGYLHNELGTDLSALPDIVSHWRKTSASLINKGTVKDMLERFYARKQDEGLEHRTLADLRQKLNRFNVHFGSQPAHEITESKIREYLIGIPQGWSRRNAYKWLKPAFEFGVETKMIAANPMKRMDAPPRAVGTPKIYTPAQFEKLLVVADAKFPELLPFLVLTGANFLRTSELIATPGETGTVLEWPAFMVEREKPLLYIRHEVAKKTSRESGNQRYVPILDITQHWLHIGPRLQRRTGFVMPFTERQWIDRRRALFEAAEVELIHNGFRHSCLSYFIAAHPESGVALTAQYAGNSEAISRQHYIQALTPGDGAAWYEIRRHAR